VLRAGMRKQLQVVLVVEAEDLVPSDSYASSRWRRGSHRFLPRTRRPGREEETIKIQVSFDQVGSPLDEALATFVRQVQAEVALRDNQVGHASKRTENARLPSDSLTDQVGMDRAPNVVEDDSRDSDGPIEADKAMYQRCGTSGHGACVDHQDDRKIQEPGHLSGAAAIALALASVVEAHDSLGQGDIGIRDGTGEPLTVDLGREHPAVEVARPPAACVRAVERVDEVGTDLEGLTVRPRRRSAAISPSVTIVLPTPLWVPTTAIALRGLSSDSAPGLAKGRSSYHGPVRTVSLLPSATDMIADLGLMDSLVGVSEDCNWPPEVASKPVVARSRIDMSGLTSAQIDEIVTASSAESHSLYAVDAELMTELRPELVITQDLCEVCAVSSGDLSTACPIGVEVYSMNPRSFQDVLESVVALADRLGVRERGLEVARTMRNKVEEVRKSVAGRSRPRVFVAEWTDPPYGSGHWLPEMVEAAGGTNLLSRPSELSFATTWEAVLADRPDLVVIAACGFSLRQSLERTKDLRLPVRTVVVDGDAHFSRPAPRLADGIRQLAHLIHPDVVADPGLPHAELPLATPAPS
jgi:iron complex transport system substrate-binding protein